MKIINDFLDWLEVQNPTWRDTVAFETLFLAPDFDITKSDTVTEYFENFKSYLNSESELTKKIGKLIYIINAFDFVVFDYDNVDTLIDTQNMTKRIIDAGEAEGRNMEHLKLSYSQGSQKFEERKEFKFDWIEYRNANLNFEILNEILKSTLLNNR